ncbi:MAG: YeeE/YedE thiosulfate transporter family protein [Geminicoccaceae bacterium]
MTASWLLAAAGLLVGVPFGALAHRTHFCTMGAISDLVLFGGRRRLRSWLLAAAVALLLTQAGVWAGLIDAATPPYGSTRFSWLASLVGGTLFGFGMVLAGGCVSRNLVRLGSGSLKSLAVVILISLSAYAVTADPFAPAAAALARAGSIDLGDSTFMRPALALAVGGLLFWYCLGDRSFRSSWTDLFAGLGIGFLVAVAWVLTTTAGDAASLNLLWPHRTTSDTAINTSGLFPIAAILGTILGAGLSGWVDGSTRLQGFTAPDDTARHVAGGILMGLGGGLAGGCTIALGVAGIGAMSLGSLVAVLGMTAGAWMALRWLEAGFLLPRPLRRG